MFLPVSVGARESLGEIDYAKKKKKTEREKFNSLKKKLDSFEMFSLLSWNAHLVEILYWYQEYHVLPLPPQFI